MQAWHQGHRILKLGDISRAFSSLSKSSRAPVPMPQSSAVLRCATSYLTTQHQYNNALGR